MNTNVTRVFGEAAPTSDRSVRNFATDSGRVKDPRSDRRHVNCFSKKDLGFEERQKLSDTVNINAY